MEMFSAVRTTGIYCRPGCSAKPRPDHVREFPLAAAAEAAGYRACLRCRPYRTSQTALWNGPELVCRAVQLVLHGALDDATEAALASRLGVSARHLRRLFTAHAGVTPDELARSRRTHFARRLLDDTDLTVTDVAFAAGFGSVRQLNRACVDVFRATPTELRARRRRHDRLAADGGLPLRLPYTGALDWTAMLEYFAARAIPGVEHVEGDTYRRTIVIDGDPGVLELSRGGDDHLVLVAHLPHWEGLIHVVDRARRVAGLDADISDAADHLEPDPLLGRLLAKRPGLRTPGTWNPFETAVRAIIGQQVSVAAATTMAGRLVERVGTPVPGLAPMGLCATFPSPETLAAADLTGLGLVATRADAIVAFSAAVAADDVRLDGSAGLDDLTEAITRLPGLGPWTAQYIALRMGERDAFPAGDLGLRRALARLEPAPRPSATATLPSARAIGQRAAAWSPWRALAATHLWAAA